MSITLKDEVNGLSNRADAELFAASYELDGWTVEIIDVADGTFTLIATKPGETSMNTGVDDGTAMEAGKPDAATPGGLKSLLDFIAKFESNGNYNAYFRHAGNTNNPRFTSKTLRAVIDWQRVHTQVNGNASSAVGRYQIIRTTLTGLVKNMNLNPATERFTQDMQDLMAKKLLQRRGLVAFQDGTKSLEDFANNVAKEWASMPVVTRITGHQGFVLSPGQSYYAGDGLNKAHAKVDDFRAAVFAAR